MPNQWMIFLNLTKTRDNKETVGTKEIGRSIVMGKNQFFIQWLESVDESKDKNFVIFMIGRQHSYRTNNGSISVDNVTVVKLRLIAIE